MKDLFRETIFGAVVRVVSGRRFLAHDEVSGSNALREYSASDSESSSRIGVEGSDNEKGKDSQLVKWTEKDPLNPRNWSKAKKFFVTFQICLLTTSVYIGSAIYTAGVVDIVEQFHVSEVAALLGLTLFVLGYALGPMVWVRTYVPTSANTANICTTRLPCRRSPTLVAILFTLVLYSPSSCSSLA